MTSPHVVVGHPPAPAVHLEEVGRRGSLGIADLVELARRDNPRRSLLMVSKVLGKHVPVEPSVLRRAAAELAQVVRDHGDGGPPPAVLAMAETATGLGLAVAEALEAPFVIHTTRRPRPGRAALHLVEEHSHAPGHLLHLDERAVAGHGLVVVDDEATSGRTIHAVRACVRRAEPRDVLGAVLVDARADEERDDAVVGLVDVRVVAADALETERDRASTCSRPARPNGDRLAVCARLEAQLPCDPALGISRSELQEYRRELVRAGSLLEPWLRGSRIIVIGLEEQVYDALVVAEALTGDGRSVVVQSTTRSPIRVSDRAGYPLAHRLELPSCTDPDAPAFVYDLTRHAGADIVVVGPATHVGATVARFRDELGRSTIHEVALS